MQCVTPILLGSNKVPCGKCNFCLQSKRMDWSFRLSQELKRASTAKFVTMTYDEPNLPWKDYVDDSGEVHTVPTLNKSDVQLYQKRLRKAHSEAWQENGSFLSAPAVRYYTVGEYGTKTLRPHYHSILFNVHPEVLSRLPDIWQKGSVQVGTVTPASIHYVTKYVINRTMDYGGREPPFSFMSKRPGIGADYLRTHTKWHRDDMRNFAQVNGVTTRLPRYYKDRIFNEDERASLAQEALELANEKFFKEIQRLCDLHDDPYVHYADRVMNMRESITSKINENSKI